MMFYFSFIRLYKSVFVTFCAHPILCSFLEHFHSLLLFTFYLSTEEQQSCNTNCECEKDSTAEGDMLEFTCKLSGRGGGNPVMAWFNNQTRLEIPNVPSQKLTGDSLSRDFSMKAFAPTVPDLVCLTRFYFSQEAGRAANVPEDQCETESCDILCKYTPTEDGYPIRSSVMQFIRI